METKLSPAMEILSSIWKHTPYLSHAHLNRTMQDALSLVINSDIRFELDDFDKINKSFRAAYWLGVSSNGNHMGDHFYTYACNNNMSAALAYENSYKRLPFILTGKRVYTNFRFKIDDLYCHITGWSKENDQLQAVGYSEYYGKGTRKLLKWNKQEWLINRKSILISDFN